MEPFPSPLEPLDDRVFGLWEVTVPESMVTSVQNEPSREVTSRMRRADDTSDDTDTFYSATPAAVAR